MHVEFVSGKGGVGKSAVTAAIARIHAARGERVLAMAMVPGGGLGPHLGLDHLTTEPVAGDEGVHALEVRRVEALEQYVRIYSPLPMLAELGRGLRAFDALATAAPGVRELITIGKILYDARQWDRVVVDAVPTGQLDSYLGAPLVIGDLVTSGRVAEQAGKLLADLRDSSTVHLVSLAEELPVTETLESLASLVDLPTPVGDVILNRLMTDAPAAAAHHPTVVHDAMALHSGLHAAHVRWQSELPEGPTLPLLFGATDPRLVSRLLAEALEPWR
ncbi:MAG: hypothetical protein HKN46_11260 [Acidimicrobiia bacterium]|nr:hypothetical protein [Acidimicrobiia bacterium]